MAHNPKCYCRYCGEPILWMNVRDGVGLSSKIIKKIPVNYDHSLELDHLYDHKVMKKHFTTCRKYKRRTYANS